MGNPTVLLCKCAIHGCLPADEVAKVEDCLGESPEVDLIVVEDLCAATMNGTAPVGVVNHVIGCHPRALRWILANDAESALADDMLHDLRTYDADHILERFSQALHSEPSQFISQTESVDAAGDGWYPVLDYDRCTHCAQCLSFCLFEVFAKDADGQVVVERPDNCKDKCPACARICPEVAIIFPKAPDSPINGDQVRDELMEREKARIALEQSGTANFRSVLDARRKGGLLNPEARERLERRSDDENDSPVDNT